VNTEKRLAVALKFVDWFTQAKLQQA